MTHQQKAGLGIIGIVIGLLFMVDLSSMDRIVNLNWDHQFRGYADITPEFRIKNYSGGSCVHASMATVLRWQHLESQADDWIKRYSGGESSQGLISKANANGIRVAYTLKADPTFLQWCSDTDRGAVIFYYANHCVTFAGYKKINNIDVAVLIDNNTINKTNQIPKDQFLKNWKAYGGFALTPVYSPTPPGPTI
jgi:hypothetical protein